MSYKDHCEFEASLNYIHSETLSHKLIVKALGSILNFHLKKERKRNWSHTVRLRLI